MDLLSLPSPAWALITGHLAPDGVLRLGATCRAAQSRNKELESSLWNSILRRELRYAAADAAGPDAAKPPDPLRTYREVRTLSSPRWMRAREPARAPKPKNGGGLARLGSGPEIILFGGSNHRISRHSSDICNEVAVLRITTVRRGAVSDYNDVDGTNGGGDTDSGDKTSGSDVGVDDLSTSDGSVVSDAGSTHHDESDESADEDEEDVEKQQRKKEEEEAVGEEDEKEEHLEVKEGNEAGNKSEAHDDGEEEEEKEEAKEDDDNSDDDGDGDDDDNDEAEDNTRVPSVSASGSQSAEATPDEQPVSALEFSAEWDVAPEVKGDPPPPRWGHSCTSVVDPADGQDAVFIYGGFGGGQILGDAYLLKRCKGQGHSEGGLVLLWEELRLDGDPPEPCAFHSATEIAPGVIVIIGGLSDGGTTTNVMFADLGRRRWIRPAMQGVPRPSRAGHAAVFVPLLNPSAATVAAPAAPAAPPAVGDGCSGALFGHLWLVGGCRRTGIGEEDEFHTTPCILEVLKPEEQHPGGTEVDSSQTPVLRWLEEATAEPMMANEGVTGRCPLCTRVGRNIIMWGGFYQGRPQHFQEELTVLDTEDLCCSAPRFLSPGVTGSSIGRAPRPREGGGCLTYVDHDKAVAMVVFGGATFDVSSDMTGVHLLVVSLSDF